MTITTKVKNGPRKMRYHGFLSTLSTPILDIILRSETGSKRDTLSYIYIYIYLVVENKAFNELILYRHYPYTHIYDTRLTINSSSTIAIRNVIVRHLWAIRKPEFHMRQDFWQWDKMEWHIPTHPLNWVLGIAPPQYTETVDLVKTFSGAKPCGKKLSRKGKRVFNTRW